MIDFTFDVSNIKMCFMSVCAFYVFLAYKIPQSVWGDAVAASFINIYFQYKTQFHNFKSMDELNESKRI